MKYQVTVTGGDSSEIDRKVKETIVSLVAQHIDVLEIQSHPPVFRHVDSTYTNTLYTTTLIVADNPLPG